MRDLQGRVVDGTRDGVCASGLTPRVIFGKLEGGKVKQVL